MTEDTTPAEVCPECGNKPVERPCGACGSVACEACICIRCWAHEVDKCYCTEGPLPVEAK